MALLGAAVAAAQLLVAGVPARLDLVQARNSARIRTGLGLPARAGALPGAGARAARALVAELRAAVVSAAERLPADLSARPSRGAAADSCFLLAAAAALHARLRARRARPGVAALGAAVHPAGQELVAAPAARPNPVAAPPGRRLPGPPSLATPAATGHARPGVRVRPGAVASEMRSMGAGREKHHGSRRVSAGRQQRPTCDPQWHRASLNT